MADMRLAIADPPYLGRAATHYSTETPRKHWGHKFREASPSRASRHPLAADWDDPATHEALCAQLVAGYDGFAIAMWRDSLRVYLDALPASVRVAVWVRTNSVPGGARVITSWEPVVVQIPAPRVGRTGPSMRDVLTCPVPAIGHTGAKPSAWTRWVLDMMGYDATTDTVDDLFPGSGAVTAEVAQQVISL